MTKEQREEHKIFTGKEIENIESCIETLPKVKITTVVKTEGLDDIMVGDVVTLIVKLERENLKGNEKANPVCSRTFPVLKQEKYYLFMTDITETNIFTFIKFTDVDREQEKEIKFQAPPGMVGNILLKIHCFSDSYVGLETSSEAKFTIKQFGESQREVYNYHEEDIKREPTLFEKAMQGMQEENSDDDLEEEEDQTKDTSGGFDSKKSKAKLSDEEEEDEE